MPDYRLFLVSEPVTAYEFTDPRSMKDISAAIARDGYCTFEGTTKRLGASGQVPSRQTVFLANIGRLIEL